MFTTSSSFLKDVSILLISLLTLLLLWHVSTLLLAVPSYLLPGPLAVFHTLYILSSELMTALFYTLQTLLLGYLVTIILNGILAFVFIKSGFLEKTLFMYIVALKIVPVIVLAPFLILWFGLGLFTQVGIVVLLSFFPLFIATRQGLAQRVELYEQLLSLYKASGTQRLVKLRLPLALPYIFAGLKTAAMFAFTGAFLAEILTGSEGIGTEIINATRFFKTEKAFAALLVAASTGVIFYSLIALLEKKVVFWKSVDSR